MKYPSLTCAFVIFLGFGCHSHAAEPDAGRVREIAGWLPAQPVAAGPSISDRSAWDSLAGQSVFQGMVTKAVEIMDKPVPDQPDELYLDYSRSGNRERWQKVALSRRIMVRTLMLAECIENKGRFIAPLERVIHALCEEKTWVYPAHDYGLKNFRGQDVSIDLGSSALGWELATASRVMGDRLGTGTQKLIRENLQRRIFDSYRESVRGRRDGNWWLLATNNWNAVCLAGVTGAALAMLESREERAWFIAAAEVYVRNFLNGFTSDGYCSEGVGYWNYGFGHYVLLSETVRRSTGGMLDLLNNPKAARPALFGARMEILNGIYPSIADCSPETKPYQMLMNALAKRFDFDLPAESKTSYGKSAKYAFETLIYADMPVETPQIPMRRELDELAWRTWFPQGGVLICRPGPGNTTPFAACLKGGNNNEHHNHNDVGTFMVVGGKSMLICDPGSEVYTSRTFSSQRYESKVLSSYGHTVPVIAGKLQRAGAAARGVVLETKFSQECDSLRLDIRSAYDVPELARLEREFVFHRGAAPTLVISDTVSFSKASTYETALVTWGSWKQISNHEIVISDGDDSVKVSMEFGDAAFELRHEVLDEDVHTEKKPVRIGIKVTSPLKQGRFTMTVTPKS